MAKARKPPHQAKTLAIIYEVIHDPATGRWNVRRGGVPTGAFARDKHTAIGLATHQASLEAHQTNLKTSVWTVEGGKKQKEWASDEA